MHGLDGCYTGKTVLADQYLLAQQQPVVNATGFPDMEISFLGDTGHVQPDFVHVCVQHDLGSRLVHAFECKQILDGVTLEPVDVALKLCSEDGRCLLYTS